MSVIIPSSKTKGEINLNLSNDNVVSTISYDERDIYSIEDNEIGTAKITYMELSDSGEFVPCYTDSEKNQYASSTALIEGRTEVLPDIYGNDVGTRITTYYIKTTISFSLTQGEISLEELQKCRAKLINGEIKAGSPEYTEDVETSINPYRVLGTNPESSIINNNNVTTPTFWVSSFTSTDIEFVFYTPYSKIFNTEDETIVLDYIGLPAYSNFTPIFAKIIDEAKTGILYGDISSDADYSISNNEFLTTGLNFSNSILNVGIEPNIISVTDTVEYQVFVVYVHNITVKLEKEAESDIKITLEYSGGVVESVVVNIAKGSLEASKRESFLVLSQKFIYGSVMPITDNKYWYCSNYELNSYSGNGTNKIMSTIYNDYKNGKQSATLSCKISEYYNESGETVVSYENGIFKPIYNDNGEKYYAIPMRYYKNSDTSISTYIDEENNEQSRLFEVYSVEFNYDNGNIYQQLKLLEKP